MNKDIKRRWLVLLRKKQLYCVLCGLLIDSAKDLSADHLTPKAKGGLSIESNLAPAHKWCNHAKADHSLEYWDKYGYYLLKSLRDSWKEHNYKYSQKVNTCLKHLKSYSR